MLMSELKDFTLIGKVSEALKAALIISQVLTTPSRNPKNCQRKAAQLAIADANDKAAFF